MTKLSSAVRDFELHMRMEGKARQTIIGYVSDLNLLVSLATVHAGDSVLAFTPELVREYFLRLSARGLTMATLHRRSATLSGFAKWGLRRRLWAHDPMADAPKIKRPRNLPRPYAREEHARIMALPLDGDEKALRALLYFAGLRISEALGLRIKDAILGDDDHPGAIRVRGKGNKERVVPMAPELRAVLYDHFIARVSLPINAFVIARGDGTPWTRKMASRRTRLWGTAASVQDCEPHRFRHTCATHLIEAGWDIREVQEFLGHADIATTVVYTQITTLRLTDRMQRLGFGVAKGEQG